MPTIHRPYVNNQPIQPAKQIDAEADAKPLRVIDCNLPLKDYFYAAVEDNKLYVASRQERHPFTTPMFRLVQHLRAYARLQRCSADEALVILTEDVNPDWEKL